MDLIRSFHRKRNYRVSVTLLALASAVLANDRAEDKGRPLLTAALNRSLLHADRNFPFRLTATLTLQGVTQRPLPGRYEWLVNSEGDWKRDISFGDYRDLQIQRGPTLWIRRSTEFQPLQAAIVQDAFSNFHSLDQPADVFERYFTTSEHHVELRCADVSHGTQARTFCVDPEENLRRIEFKDSKILYEYSDYRPAGRKFAPYKIVAKRQGTILLEADVKTLSIDPQVDSHLLEPPEGAMKRDGCLAPTLPVLKDKVLAEYPKIARNGFQQGQVMLYVLIGKDGAVHNVVITQTAGLALDSAALKAVPHWQFEPAKCGGLPVEFETEIPVNFALELR